MLARVITSHPRAASSFIHRYKDYKSLIEDAKLRAQNTILIEHDADQHFLKLEGVRNIFSLGKGTSLLEFISHRALRKATEGAIHQYGKFPLKTRMFRMSSQPKSIQVKKCTSTATMEKEFSTFEDLLKHHRMSEYAFRLRFFTLSQLEDILCQGLFTEYELLPFGSSVLEIGSNSSDLDILMTRKNYEKWFVDSHVIQQSTLPLVHCDSDLTHIDEHYHRVIGINLLASTLKTFMPSIRRGSVLSIPKARVPIVKFTFDLTDVDCDLSLNLGLTKGKLSDCHSGPLMSKLLFAICKSTNIFAAFATCIRSFARLRGITSSMHPNQSFTNFQLLTLIIFYLQQVPIPHQVKWKTGRQKFIIAPLSSSGTCTSVNSRSSECDYIHNPDSQVDVDEEVLYTILPNLIVDFFDYYDKFDFVSRGICLLSGKTFNRYQETDDRYSPVHVVNPFDRNLNVCKNVSEVALGNFLKEIRAALKDINEKELSSSCLLEILMKLNQGPVQSSQLCQVEETELDIGNISNILFQEELDKDKVS